MDTVELFKRSEEDAADLGPAQFSFSVLRDLHNDEREGKLDKEIGKEPRIGRVRVRGYARDTRTGQRVTIDSKSNYHVITGGKAVVASARALMREEVSARTGSASGARGSEWEYNTEVVTIEWKAEPKPKPKRLPPSRAFRKKSGRWQRYVPGYTKKNGQKVKGYYRQSSRAEYLRYKNG